MTQKNIRLLIAILLTTILITVITIVGVKCFAYNSIKNIEDKIKTNEEQIVNITAAKTKLHETANAFRKLNSPEDDFINVLQIKWEQLEIKENELKKLNEKYWDEIESISSKRKFIGQFELTAYYQGSITSTGTAPTENRTIAVDPTVIPYGTIVEIEGYGTFVAEDCGGAVKGNIIDIYMKGKDNCVQFGRRKANVYIIK